MIGEKRSRSRRRWKTDNPGDSIVEHLEYATYSFENETASLIGNRASDSGGKAGNSRRRGKQVSDDSEIHADSDNLTYTKDAPETTQKNVESPVNAILKVEEYLTRHEKQDDDPSPDDDRVSRQKRRKSRSKRGENIATLGSPSTEVIDAYDENTLLTEKGKSDSPQSHPETKQKRRKWQKIQRERNSTVGFSEMIEDGARDEDERETESPENYLETKERRWKSKRERDEKNRALESIATIEGDARDEDGGSSEKLEIASPENNPESNGKRRSSRGEGDDKNRTLESIATIEADARDEDGGSSDRREAASPENNSESREKRRKSRKEEREKSRILESNATVADGDSSERRESASPENNPERREKRRKSRKERKERSRKMASNRTLDDEAHDDDRRESGSPENDVERRERRRKSRKSRKDKNRTLESSQTHDEDAWPKSKKPEEPRISRRRKRRRSKADSSRRAEKHERELPITEILRKAQEDSRNRYDEPVALPELTTDTIYVQGRNGFSAVKLAEGRSARGRRSSPTRETTLYPIKVAIAAQTVWNSTGLIHQGLLAGMALMHLILIQTFFELSLDFLVDYSLIAELYTNIFSFLVTMCVVSVLDKFDLAHLDLAHLREIYVEHSRSFLAVPLYVSAFCLHQATLLVDDKVALMSYAGNATEFGSNSTESMIEEDLVTWQKVTLAKDGLAVLAWLFVALGPREDMLLTHLKTMEKYADSPESSRRDIVEAMRREHEKRAMNKKEQSVN